MALVQDQICIEQVHSFEFVNYFPDFEHQCYSLHFECENCGLEVFDKVNGRQVENHDDQKYHFSTYQPETSSRYMKKSIELCIQDIQRANPRSNEVMI
jgi:hypothetical protein